MRVIGADTHPDQDTIGTLRREHKNLLAESFVKVLPLAPELKLLRVGQRTPAGDGTKILAKASKHAAVRYERAGKPIEPMERAVQPWLEKAEQADRTPLPEGLHIPDAIVRGQERKARWAQARAELEARAKARAAAELLESPKKREARAAQQERGERVGGPEPPPPHEPPRPSDPSNFTDPDSRIRKAGSGPHVEQADNAQAAVEVESRWIVAAPVRAAPNATQPLEPTLAAIAPEVGGGKDVLVDSGFYSAKAVRALEPTATGALTGVGVYAAMEKTGHHRRVEDWEAKVHPPTPRPGARVAEGMRHRLATTAGRAQ